MPGRIQETIKSIGRRIEERIGMSENAEIYLELRSVRNHKTSGVPFDSWTERNRKRLELGQKPIGHPEHPNV